MLIFSEPLDKPAIASEDLMGLVTPIQPEWGEWPVVSRAAPWIVIRSRVLDEDVLLVCDRAKIERAQKVHPTLTTYTLPEMDVMRDYARDPATIRRLHLIKKRLNGWISRPSNGRK